MNDMSKFRFPVDLPEIEPSKTTRDILNELCTPWCIFVIDNLASGPRRFTELKRAVEGISQRMLAVSLRVLERDGLILRSVDSGKPIKVTYALTERGKTFAGPARALIDWAIEHQQSIEALRSTIPFSEDE